MPFFCHSLILSWFLHHQNGQTGVLVTFCLVDLRLGGPWMLGRPSCSEVNNKALTFTLLQQPEKVLWISMCFICFLLENLPCYFILLTEHAKGEQFLHFKNKSMPDNHAKVPIKSTPPAPNMNYVTVIFSRDISTMHYHKKVCLIFKTDLKFTCNYIYYLIIWPTNGASTFALKA